MSKVIRILSILVVIVSYLVAIVIFTGPFDPPLCSLTIRRFGCPAPIVKGKVEKGYEPVLEAFKKQFETGYSRGAQLSVWKDAKMVVDIYGSYVEENYTDESLQIVFSSTKAMSPLVLAMLEERGLIDWYKPIATYWPEFGQHGKEKLTIAELMRHETGLDGFNNSVPWDVFINLDNEQKAIHKFIEESSPVWVSYTRRAYHAFTRGIIENEIVKRVDPKKRNVGQYYEEEIRKPLGISFWIGLPDEQFKRFHIMHQWPEYYQVARVLFPYYLGILDDDIKHLVDIATGKIKDVRTINAILNPPDTTLNGQLFCRPDALKTISPSTNGVSNAKSLGTILALIANGGELHGVRLLKQDTINRMLAITTPPMKDAGLGISTLFTDGGYAKNVIGKIGDKDFYGWGGWGGSVVQFSPELNVAVSFVMNGMGVHLLGDPRFDVIKKELSQIWKK